MSRWKAGDVALDPNYRLVAFVVSKHFSGCAASHPESLHVHYNDGDWNDSSALNRLRPLVVIDPEDREEARRVLAAYAARVQEPFRGEDEPDDWRVDRMQAALHSLVAPPKPEEPTDPAARVKTSNGVEWAKVGPWWVCAELSQIPRDWDYLVDLLDDSEAQS